MNCACTILYNIHVYACSVQCDVVQELELMEGEGPNRNKKKTAIKQAHRKTFYVVCQEAGLGSLAAKFGLTPEQFGENLRDNYQRHETEQYTVEPEEVAQDYVQPTGSDMVYNVFNDNAVIAGIRYMMMCMYNVVITFTKCIYCT